MLAMHNHTDFMKWAAACVWLDALKISADSFGKVLEESSFSMHRKEASTTEKKAVLFVFGSVLFLASRIAIGIEE